MIMKMIMMINDNNENDNNYWLINDNESIEMIRKY